MTAAGAIDLGAAFRRAATGQKRPLDSLIAKQQLAIAWWTGSVV